LVAGVAASFALPQRSTHIEWTQEADTVREIVIDPGEPLQTAVQISPQVLNPPGLATTFCV
jgi:hypothetical protein